MRTSVSWPFSTLPHTFLYEILLSPRKFPKLALPLSWLLNSKKTVRVLAGSSTAAGAPVETNLASIRNARKIQYKNCFLPKKS